MILNLITTTNNQQVQVTRKLKGKYTKQVYFIANTLQLLGNIFPSIY